MLYFLWSFLTCTFHTPSNFCTFRLAGTFKLNDATSHTIPSSMWATPWDPGNPFTRAPDGTLTIFLAIPHRRWESGIWCTLLFSENFIFCCTFSIMIWFSFTSECFSILNSFVMIWMQKKHSNSVDIWFWSTIWLSIKIYLLWFI